MTVVSWCPFRTDDTDIEHSLDLAHFDVEPVIPHIMKARNHQKGVTYLSCPAFLDYYKNTYVVRSPITTKLTVNPSNRFLSMHSHTQEFYDAFIRNRADTIGQSDPALVSIGTHYLFTASEDCLMEQLPPIFHSEKVENIRVIPGTFDISKWFRPVELSFEIVDQAKPVIVNGGDAMFYVRFVPKSGGKVTLQKNTFTDEQLAVVRKCFTLKQSLDKQPLKILYELANPFRHLFKKKCPFNWRNK